MRGYEVALGAGAVALLCFSCVPDDRSVPGDTGSGGSGATGSGGKGGNPATTSTGPGGTGGTGGNTTSSSSTGVAPTCTDMMQNGDETDKDCGGGTCGGCAIGFKCLESADCDADLVCDKGNTICRVAHSCLELHVEKPALPTGIHDIDVNGLAPPSTKAYCDMDTDGGGWTALINPKMGNLDPTLKTVTPPTATSPMGNCSVTLKDTPPMGNGGEQFSCGQTMWNGFWADSCGWNYSVTFKWQSGNTNPLGAHDVMFEATVQSSNSAPRSITVNNMTIMEDALDLGDPPAPMHQCSCWNLLGQCPNRPANAICGAGGGIWCIDQCLDQVPPHRINGILGGGPLVLTATIGNPTQNCQPDCCTSYGMNIQKLFVR